MATCNTCKGTKHVHANFLGALVETECPECKGTGETGVPGVCAKCNGSKKTVVDCSGFGIEVDCPDCCPIVIVE